MASAFDGFSLSKVFQHNTINRIMKLYFILKLNPILLDLIRRSDQHQFLSRYMTMLDESYIALLDRYPPDSLALLLSIIIHENIFSSQATKDAFQLLPNYAEHDTLCIIREQFSLLYYILGPADTVQVSKEHRAALREFVLDPARSRHHNFQRSNGKMYAKSLLACFSFLDTQLFRYNYCPHCFPDRHQLIPFNTEESEEDLNDAFHEQEIGNKSEGHQTANEDWDKYFSNNPENVDIVDTEKDIQAWSANWDQVISRGEDAQLNCPVYKPSKK